MNSEIRVLAINGGSSSIQFAVFEACDPPHRGSHGGICEGLGCLGVDLDEACNAANKEVISSAASRVAVRVLCTDEAATIARAVCQVLDIR